MCTTQVSSGSRLTARRRCWTGRPAGRLQGTTGESSTQTRPRHGRFCATTDRSADLAEPQPRQATLDVPCLVFSMIGPTGRIVLSCFLACLLACLSCLALQAHAHAALDRLTCFLATRTMHEISPDSVGRGNASLDGSGFGTCRGPPSSWSIQCMRERNCKCSFQTSIHPSVVFSMAVAKTSISVLPFPSVTLRPLSATIEWHCML